MYQISKWLQGLVSKKEIIQVRLAEKISERIGRNFNISQLQQRVRGDTALKADELLAILDITNVSAPRLFDGIEEIETFTRQKALPASGELDIPNDLLASVTLIVEKNYLLHGLTAREASALIITICKAYMAVNKERETHISIEIFYEIARNIKKLEHLETIE